MMSQPDTTTYQITIRGRLSNGVAARHLLCQLIMALLPELTLYYKDLEGCLRLRIREQTKFHKIQKV